MRRLFFTVVASMALLAMGPATALAKHHHHKRTHHSKRHSSVRHKRFGTDTTSTTTTTSPTTPSSDTAGTIKSFDSTTGILTITLNDGTTDVTGKVTNATDIECEAADTSTTEQSDLRSDGGGDTGGSSDSGDSGDNGSGDHGDQSEQSCTSTNLTAGTVVNEAELRISSAGATWDKVEIQSTSTSTTTGGGDDTGDSGD